MAGGNTRTNLIYGCVFSNNSATSHGAILVSSAFPATFQNCTIVGNYAAGGHSGGISLESSRNIVRGCLVVGNIGSSCGGIFAYSGTSNLIDSCTVAQNYASSSVNGGGITHYVAGNIFITNCISWSNYSGGTILAPANTNDNLTFANAGSTGYVDHCCIYTNVATMGVGYSNRVYTSSITNNPQFVNIGTAYGTNLLNGAYDFRLQQASPCYNTGTNEPWMATAFDLAGNPWTVSPPNIGCFNNQYSVGGNTFVWPPGIRFLTY